MTSTNLSIDESVRKNILNLWVCEVQEQVHSYNKDSTQVDSDGLIIPGPRIEDIYVILTKQDFEQCDVIWNLYGKSL